MLFSAGRSRRVSMVPIIQSFARLQKNYGKEGSEIIIDNCQDILFGGFAPNSESAKVLSKALGNKTVLSGSISREKNDPNQSLKMIQRPLILASSASASCVKPQSIRACLIANQKSSCLSFTICSLPNKIVLMKMKKWNEPIFQFRYE